MAFKFITVPIHETGESATELNTFLNSHKVLAVERRWVDQGSSSFWSFCIDYVSGVGSQKIDKRSNSERNKIDYKEVLKPEEFAIFAKLRDRRKEIAEKEGVPVYAIFNNEQLAKMVQTRATTRAALAKIDGIGEAKLEKYAAAMLELLTPAGKTENEAERKPV